MPRVSVIIPVYCDTNQKVDWLIDCVESVAKQDAEIVLYDDGSPIHTDVFNHKNVRYFRGVHGGVSSARNQAVIRATCDLILPLDCDDMLADNAINKLLSHWDGNTPVYPDVAKFGLENIPHYALLDFSCEHILKHVGFSSVNVLHSVDQWRSIGGWNESIDFFEDGEYNARLFSKYCGKRLPEPLVHYRIHDLQRTAKYKKQSAYYANKILEMIRRLDMACKSCGGGRRIFDANTVATVVPSRLADVNSMPGELNGRVLAQYIGGKGRAKHYYRGPKTNFPYKVVCGDYVYVDPSDARKASDTTETSLLIFVEKKPQPVVVQAPQQLVPTVVVENDTITEVVREARKQVSERVSVPIDKQSPFDFPDIHNLSVKEILSMDAIPVDVAKKLLKLEKNGKNRVKVTAHLEKMIND